MNKTGLVFSGGGAKGAYEIGVWMALRDLEIEQEISGVSGTSIGALNMALFSQGDLQNARALWMNLLKSNVIKLDISKAMLITLGAAAAAASPKNASLLARYLKPGFWAKTGIYSKAGLKSVIQDNLNLLKVSNSQIPLWACCCEVPLLKPQYFQLAGAAKKDITTILLASSAIPGAFDGEIMNGSTFFDGGLRDNVPVKPLYDAGFCRFIVVDLYPERDLRKEFPGAQIWLISPGNPGKRHENTLHFEPQYLFKQMNAGCHDATRLLANFPAVNRPNLYQSLASAVQISLNETVSLENGLDITIHEIHHQKSENGGWHLLADASVRLTSRYAFGDACLLMASSFILALPDGRRFYPNMYVEGGSVFRFPDLLEMGTLYRKYIPFHVPEDVREFIFYMKDTYNDTVQGRNCYIACRME